MEKEIKIPKICPSCLSTLERVKDQLFCRNDLCSAKNSKKVYNFAQKMKIKGLGEKRIELLDFEDIKDIYLVPLEFYVDALGEKVGAKVFAEVEASKSSSLEQLLPAFSIPLIGTAAAAKLAGHVSQISHINKSVCEFAGLGEVATGNLLEWMSYEWNYNYSLLPIKLTTDVKRVVCNKGTVVVTGKIEGHTRISIKERLEELGFKVTTSISKNTNYLVCEDLKPSSKLAKAKELGIDIKTLKELENAN